MCNLLKIAVTSSNKSKKKKKGREKERNWYLIFSILRSSSFFVPDKGNNRRGATEPNAREIPRSLSTGVSVGVGAGIGAAAGVGPGEVGLGAPRDMRLAYESAPTPNLFVSPYESTTTGPSAPTNLAPSTDDAYAYADLYTYAANAYANESVQQTQAQMQTYTQAYQPHQTAPQTHRRNQSGMSFFRPCGTCAKYHSSHHVGL